MPKPILLDDPAFRELREYDIKHFVEHTQGRETIDFSGTDLRAVDLSQVDVSKLVLRDAYLRDADLRGLDLRNLDLEGCSLHNAKISGVYFPKNVSPQEIQNSVVYGTRIRTS
ncbi:MAG: pentapeptide repeat-containing protein [Pirellulales bacterium]|nr:pentapeptide repeat-containing protein [Pirellulales bacterium]